jgi:probable HAF family extracellular repeat protein
MTDLGDLADGADYSGAVAINCHGQLVGAGDGAMGRHAVLWDAANHTPYDLESLLGEAGQSEAYAINGAGDVVGWSDTATGRGAFLREPGTRMQPLLPYLPGGGAFAEAYGVNDAKDARPRQVVGWSDSDTGLRACLWDPDKVIPLGTTPEPSDSSLARGINNNVAAKVVGSYEKWGIRTCAFVWDAENGIRRLPDLPGAPGASVAVGINDAEQIVGHSRTTTGWHACLWDAQDVHDLGDLPGGDDDSRAVGINAGTQVVGWSAAATGLHAFLWEADDGMRDLNNLVDGSAAGWELLSAWGINDEGCIVGQGRNPAGAAHAILLTPVPEPSSVCLAVLVLGTLALRRTPRIVRQR